MKIFLKAFKSALKVSFFITLGIIALCLIVSTIATILRAIGLAEGVVFFITFITGLFVTLTSVLFIGNIYEAKNSQ